MPERPIEVLIVEDSAADVYLTKIALRDAKVANKIHVVEDGEEALAFLKHEGTYADAPRPDLALKFINFMLDGKNSAELSNLIGSGNPNADAAKYIKPEIAKNAAIFPDKATFAKLEMLKDLNGKQRRALNRLWTEIRAR